MSINWRQAWTKSTTPRARVIWPLTTDEIAGRTALWQREDSTCERRAELPEGKRLFMSDTIGALAFVVGTGVPGF